MRWNYKCPECNSWGSVDWEKRNNSFNCHNCKSSHTPPSPAEQRDAYVETHRWPVEMEDQVVNSKGNKCTVPGCNSDYETLDHRHAFSRGGKTSFENLFPMCASCNSSKSDTDYNVWLLTRV